MTTRKVQGYRLLRPSHHWPSWRASSRRVLCFLVLSARQGVRVHTIQIRLALSSPLRPGAGLYSDLPYLLRLVRTPAVNNSSTLRTERRGCVASMRRRTSTFPRRTSISLARLTRPSYRCLRPSQGRETCLCSMQAGTMEAGYAATPNPAAARPIEISTPSWSSYVRAVDRSPPLHHGADAAGAHVRSGGTTASDARAVRRSHDACEVLPDLWWVLSMDTT